MTTPKILVTGGAGFIGSHVVDRFCAQGWAVVVVDNLSTGNRANLNAAATLYAVDLRDMDALAAVFERERPTHVSHHAAQVNVRYSLLHPTEDASINVLGSLNVLQCAARHGVQHFLYISSSGAIYGEPQYLPCDEQHPLNSLSPYGISKHTVEHYLPSFQRDAGLAYSVLRYPNVYGPRQDAKGEAGVIAIFVDRMLTGAEVVINGDGEQQRDFVYATDCAQANWLVLSQGRTGIYNLGTGVGTSVNTLFGALRDLTGYTLPPQHHPAIPGEVLTIYSDAQKARRELGWEPAMSLTAGLRATVEAFRKKEG